MFYGMQGQGYDESLDFSRVCLVRGNSRKKVVSFGGIEQVDRLF